MRDASAQRPSSARMAAMAAGVIVVAAIAWTTQMLAVGLAPWSDTALYLDTALHLGHGDGLVSTMGFPVAPSAMRPFPFPFHPVGGVAVYALAALGTGLDRYALALSL